MEITAEEKNEEIKPLKEQQLAIDSIKNTVVAAGAGSGKTKVLALRYLNLVKKYRYNVDQILTLTFTKKATVEMSDRIYKVLKKEEPEQAAVFYKSKIQTLDAYCSSVAKEGCRFYGVSPDFVLDQEAVNEQTDKKALEFLLEHKDCEALKPFIKTNNAEEIANELFAAPVKIRSKIAEPVDFRGDLCRQYKTVVEKWNAAVKGLLELIEEQIRYLEEFEGNRESSFYNKASEILAQNELPEPVFVSYENMENPEEEKFVDFYKKVCGYFNLPKPGKTKGMDEQYRINIDIMRSDYVGVFPALINYIHGIPYVNKVIPLFEEFQNIIMDYKRTSKCLTHADISNLALHVLKEHPEIRLIEKKKYKAIMIDEFQDNNQDQRDLLFLLAEKPDRMEEGVPSIDELEKEKLFFVGDEKQSIYRFRGADVEVFNALSEDFKDGKLEMYTNHRSHPELISAFNTIFGGERYGSPAAQKAKLDTIPPAVFFTEKQEKTEKIPQYEAVYHNVLIPDYREKKENKTVDDPRIHLAFYDETAEAENDYLTGVEAEIEWIAREIDKKIAEGENPSEIAVLLRNYTYQPVFERVFLQHGIPYNTEQVMGFFSDGPVCDIIFWLELCIYEDDTFSYMHALRSPFVNLNITEAEAVISCGQKPFDEQSEKCLEGEALERFRKAKEYLEETKTVLKEKLIAEAISFLWYGLGYRYETMWNNVVKMYGKLYDILFEIARQADAKNMNPAAFIDYVKEYGDESVKLEVSVPLEKAEGVQIMSIHKSKGLEFNTVFVSCINKKGKRDTNSEVLYINKEYGVTLNTPLLPETGDLKKSNFFFDMAKAEENAMVCAELRRLTYVALTRAENELYITGYKNPLNFKDALEYAPSGSKVPESIAQILAPLISYYHGKDEKGMAVNEAVSPFLPVELIPPYPRNVAYSGNGRNNTAAEKIKLVKELASDSPYSHAQIIKKEAEEDIYILPSKLHETDDETAERSEGGALKIKDFDENAPYGEINSIIEKHPAFGYANFGTIAHAYMESLINGTEGNEPYSNREITGLDGDEKALKQIQSVCESMRAAFKESTIGKEALEAVWKQSEYPFRSRTGSKIVKGTIDLVYEKPDGTFVVVDFKTNTTIHPEIYYEQLACYKQAVSQMMGVDESKVKCVLYYLRFAHEEDITEECRITRN